MRLARRPAALALAVFLLVLAAVATAVASPRLRLELHAASLARRHDCTPLGCSSALCHATARAHLARVSRDDPALLVPLLADLRAGPCDHTPYPQGLFSACLAEHSVREEAAFALHAVWGSPVTLPIFTEWEANVAAWQAFAEGRGPRPGDPTR